MWPFKKRKPESSEEIAAEKRLDEVTRQVAWGEFDKEADRERTGLLPGTMVTQGHGEPFHRVEGDPVPEPVDDADPGDEHGLREALHEGEEKKS
jgi:hypothetical protein